MKFSLVLATISRVTEVECFFESLIESTHKDFEVIVVDQNDKPLIDQIITKYSDIIDVIHIKPTLKGLSKARNLGLKYVTGDVICFPDDDCKFYPNTLWTVKQSLFGNENLDAVIGRIFDLNLNQNVIKKWPKKSCFVNEFNFYFLSSSITLFIRRGVLKKTIGFDEQLGAGEQLGSCEDPDFIYRMLKSNYKVFYNPSINVWHPISKNSDIPNEKVYLYASGFGGFIRKEFSFVKLYLFCGICIKKSIQFIMNKNEFNEKYFTSFFRGLIFGIKNYESKK